MLKRELTNLNNTIEVLRMIFLSRNLLDEVLETMDILTDEELMKAIRESEDAIEKGETRDLKDFVKELGLENYHLR